MAEWRLKRGMPEWHQVMRFRDILRDGTLIEAYTEDCDGDIEYWGVKENGVLVAEGRTDCSQDAARLAAERVICFGAGTMQNPAAALWRKRSEPDRHHIFHPLPASMGKGACRLHGRHGVHGGVIQAGLE